MIGRKLFLVTCAILAYGYKLYKPLPPDLDSPIQSAVFIGAMKIVDDIVIKNITYHEVELTLQSVVASYFGISPLNTTRAILDSTAAVINPISGTSLKIEDTEIEGIKVRTYTPKNARKFGPGIIFIHGGGFVMGGLDTHDPPLRYLSTNLRLIVISIQYRLAPENPFPKPFEDCKVVVEHILSRARYFNVSPKKIIIMGDSAGGNLAATVSLKLRDDNFQPMPDLQVLVYPTVQGFDFNLPSYVRNDGTTYGSRIWAAQFMVQHLGFDLKHAATIANNGHISPHMRKQYFHLVDIKKLPVEFQKYHPLHLSKVNKDLAESMEKIITDTRFCPLMAQNLTGLPEAYIITAGHDIIRDDGYLYTEKLRQQKVRVTHQHYENTFHGVFTLIGHPLKIDAGLLMVRDIEKFVKGRYKLRI